MPETDRGPHAALSPDPHALLQAAAQELARTYDSVSARQVNVTVMACRQQVDDGHLMLGIELPPDEYVALVSGLARQTLTQITGGQIREAREPRKRRSKPCTS